MERTPSLERTIISRHAQVYHRSGSTNIKHKRRRDSELYGWDLQEAECQLKCESHEGPIWIRDFNRAYFVIFYFSL